MITSEQRHLLPDEIIDARLFLSNYFGPLKHKQKIMYWIVLSSFGVVIFFTGISSSSLYVLLSLILLSVLYFLLFGYIITKFDSEKNRKLQILHSNVESGRHYVVSITNAEFIEIQAYGIKLWLAQADFSSIFKLKGTGLLSHKFSFPSSSFKIIALDLDSSIVKFNPIDGTETNILSFYKPTGEPVLPLAVIGPQEYERIRHIVPDDGEPGHGRLTAMLDLLGYRPAPKANLPTQPGASA
jgi:hypothetical protein